MVRSLSQLTEVEAIAEIAERISASHELDQILQTVVGSVLRLLRADLSAIALIDENDELRICAIAGEDSDLVGSLVHPESGLPLDQREFRSIAALPITQGQVTLGTLWAARRAGRQFSRRDLTLLKHLTIQAAIAVSNARSLGRERQARAEAAALNDIGQRISASLDLGQVLQTTIESANRLVGGDMSGIALPRTDGQFQMAAVVGNRTAAFSELLFPAQAGFGGRALQEGKALQVTWNSSENSAPYSSGTATALAGEGIASSLAIPVMRASEPIAIFWIHSRTPRTFSEGQIQLLQRLAGQAAVGIMNARTHAGEQAARSQVEALLAATAGLGGRAEPMEVMRALVEQAAELLDAECASYSVLNEELPISGGLWRNGAWEEDSHAIDLKGSIQGEVWRTGEAYVANDLSKEPLSNADFDRKYGLRSQITVPMLSRDGPVGLVSVYNSQRAGGFTEADKRLLSGFAEYASSAYRRAHASAVRQAAEREAKMRRREVEALLEVADRLTSASDPGEVLRGIMAVIAPLLRSRRVGIVTNEGDHALSGGLWDDGVWRPGGTRIPIEGSISGWVIQNKRPWKSDDLSRDPLHFQGIAALRGIPIKASLAVPILSGDGRVLGVLNIHSSEEDLVFQDEDVQLAEGIARHVAVALERASLIRELRDSEERFRHQAFTDSLTGLPNRASLLEKLGAALTRGRERGNRVALIFLDLDGFKRINDSLGHTVGDEILGAIAQRLQANLGAGEMIARIGGDEFVILLDEVDSSQRPMELAELVLSAIRQPFNLRGRERYLTASAGVSISAPASAAYHSERLLREADIALYAAKARGKAKAALFDPSMSSLALDRMDLEADLQRAMERGELELHYQPVFDLRTKALNGAEALIRWNHPRRGLLAASEFINLAEETGLVLTIGDWAFEHACRCAAQWQKGPDGSQPIVSVNLSARQFQQPGLLGRIGEILRMTGIEPSSLEVEITESTMILDMNHAIETMESLRERGIRLAIDDFGTGYSSLSYLRRLSVDRVKIDRSFITALDNDAGTATIVRSVIELAHALKMTVTAEGIETLAEMEFLCANGCDFGQGFYLSAAVPSEDLNAFLVGSPA